MADLRESFSEVPEFFDLRYEAYQDCLAVMQQIREIESDSMAEVIDRVIAANALQKSRVYNDKHFSLVNGNHVLIARLRNINFDVFESDLRGIIYV